MRSSIGKEPAFRKRAIANCHIRFSVFAAAVRCSLARCSLRVIVAAAFDSHKIYYGTYLSTADQLSTQIAVLTDIGRALKNLPFSGTEFISPRLCRRGVTAAIG